MITVLLLLMFFIILQLHNRCGHTAPSLQSSLKEIMGWALTQIGFWSFHVCGYMLRTTKTSTSIDSFLFPYLFCNSYCCKMCSHKTLGSNEFLRIIMNHWWKENFQVSQDTFEFILNMKAVILNRFKSGNPPMFLNFRAVTKARVLGLPWLLWARP